MTPPVKTREVFEFLKVCADEMRTVTYGDVAKACGLAPVGTGYQLGYIRDEICRKRGLPWLSAIAVNTDTRRPAESFMPEGVRMGRDEDRLWRGMVLQVFAYDWSSVPFEES